MDNNKKEDSLLRTVVKKEPKTKYVNEEFSLLVREKPNKNSNILGVLLPKQKVLVINEEQDWDNIQYKEKTAYVMNKYLVE